MQTVTSIFWRKLDTAGHDACRLEQSGNAWQLDGAAVFRQADGRVAQLHYRVRCDTAWHTQWGTVRGWIGAETIDISIMRDTHGGWKVNDVAVPDLGHCVDLDLGFTPATNLLPLRRLRLQYGEGVDAPAAWLDLENGALGELQQRYERVSDHHYAYAAPRFGYAETLDVTTDGFVSRYPQLWEAEA